MDTNTPTSDEIAELRAKFAVHEREALRQRQAAAGAARAAVDERETAEAAS